MNLKNWLRLLMVAFWAAQAAAVENLAVRQMSTFSDSGTFVYYDRNNPVGESRFTWGPDGFFNRISVSISGQIYKAELRIETTSEGRWNSISYKNDQGLTEITAKNDSIRIRSQAGEQSFASPDGLLIMEDMSPALLSQITRTYDREMGGIQRFPLLFLPSNLMEASLEHLGTVQKELAGSLKIFHRYRAVMAPIYTFEFLTDENFRICLVEYPEQNGVFVRKGMELQEKTEEDPMLSKPEYGVFYQPDVPVPMRDGVTLMTDITRPDANGQFPVILVRTPYKKELSNLQASYFASRGYAFAVQDVRGRFASEGEWEPFVHEARDGYDAVEWLASQPWSNGKIGMLGASYLGWTQWWAASQKPPHLVTLIPNVSPPEPYFNFPYDHGTLMLAPGLWWISVVENKATEDMSGITMVNASELLKGGDEFRYLPVIDLDRQILGKEIPFWRKWIRHPNLDRYWKSLNFMDAMKEMNIPVYHQSGWFDGDGIGSKLNYLGMKKHGHQNQKLVLGPWDHTPQSKRALSTRHDFGPEAVVDLQSSYLRWMDRWLKDIQNGIDKEPSVSLFIMGSNHWVHGDSYPLEGTRLTPYYLTGGGSALSSQGRGWLTETIPSDSAAVPDRYLYDPGDPTPTFPAGRRDLLRYRTPAFEKSMTIAGPVSGVLYASTSARDTDWIMRLAKIDRDGRPLILGQGVIRAKYRDSFSRPKLLKRRQIVRYDLDMWQTGVTVQPGEYLELLVQSALFPWFSRNLNTGGHNEMETQYVTAEQILYHDAEHPSHVLLPVIDLDEKSEVLEKSAFGDSNELARFEGQYRIRPGFDVHIFAQDGRLLAEVTGQPVDTLEQLDPDRYLIPSISVPITFIRDEEGNIPHFVLEQQGIKIQAWNLNHPQESLDGKPEPVTLTPDQLQRLVGKYRLSQNQVFTLSIEGDGLFVQLTGQMRIQIYPESENRFFYTVVDARIHFVRGPDGRPAHLVLHQNGMHFQADRIE